MLEDISLTAGVAGAALAGGAAAWLGYSSMAPRSQFFGQTWVRSPNPKQLALTYDDGPNDPYTLRLLELLAKEDVRATFFLIGKYVRQRPEIARQVAAAGHVIGNHTFTHPNLIFAGQKRTEIELDDCERALAEAVGDHSKLFRPPFGKRRPQVLRTVRRKGLAPVMWSVTCYDWEEAVTADQIMARAVRQIRGGDVILLHDGGHREMGADRSASIAASQQLIRRYRQEGFEFVTVPEMMKAASEKSG